MVASDRAQLSAGLDFTLSTSSASLAGALVSHSQTVICCRSIPGNVSLKLTLPVRDVAARKGSTLAVGVAVPKTPMYKDGYTPGRQNDVRRARQIFGVQSVTEPSGEKSPSYY